MNHIDGEVMTLVCFTCWYEGR